MKQSVTEILFEKHLRELGLTFFPEYHFHPGRKWRFDYILTNPSGAFVVGQGVAIEIEGGTWTNGRHSRGKGYQADLDKYNAATAMGYKVFRFSTQDILRGRAKAFLQEHLKP